MITRLITQVNYLYFNVELRLLGLWDGKSFIPLDFSLHHEPGKNKNRGLIAKQIKAQHSYSRPSDSAGQQRINEVSLSKIAIAVEMIKRAVKSGLCFEYVLADSWFISEVVYQRYSINLCEREEEPSCYWFDENQ